VWHSFTDLVRRQFAHSAANWISLYRFAMGACIVVIAATYSGRAGAAVAVLLATGFLCSITLDAVDGWVARRQGKSSYFGSFVDVFFDRSTEYACWLVLASESHAWLICVIVIMVRDVLVDGTKFASALAGHSLEIGVKVPAGWRHTVVASRWSKGSYNAIKACAIGAAIVAVASGGAKTLATVLLGALAIHSLVRGVASISELPTTIRGGRVGEPHELTAGFAIQFLVGVGVLSTILMRS